MSCFGSRNTSRIGALERGGNRSTNLGSSILCVSRMRSPNPF
jgi:hypothetical protein